jgi:hypothetical protein
MNRRGHRAGKGDQEMATGSKIELIEKANPDWLDLFQHTANP